MEESPPLWHPTSFSNIVFSPKLHDIFINLEGINVGFKHWHPVPVTQNGGRLSGQGEMGGLWEWTSTVLENYEGFEAMDLYPGYTGIFQVLFLDYA